MSTPLARRIENLEKMLGILPDGDYCQCQPMPFIVVWPNDETTGSNLCPKCGRFYPVVLKVIYDNDDIKEG
jgi:hypothetical protein